MTTQPPTHWRMMPRPKRALRHCWQCALVLCFGFLLWPTGVAQAATFTVTNTNDSGAGSLRQAILDANARSGVDLILFSLGSGVQTIRPNSALPTITDTVEINALSGGTCATMPPQPRVLLDGSVAGSNVSGFKIQANTSRIVGFYITKFSGHGVEINANDVVVACNVIGLNNQDAAAGNVNYGVKINGNNNIIGRLGSLTGNVVSANFFGIVIEDAFSGNIIRGNFVGTNSDGSQDRGNANVGVAIAFGTTNTTVGGNTAADRNVIAGNDTEGIHLLDAGSNNRVIGNLIGLNAAGTAGLPNTFNGVLFEGASGNTVGGTGNGDGNRIAFNNENGIAVDNASRNNRFLGNQIFSNRKLGIDLGNDGVTPNDNGDGDSGANDKQNVPILSGALINTSNQLETEAVLSSTPNTTFRIDFFSSDSCDATGFGEGATFLGSGSMTTNSGGNGLLGITFPPIPDGRQVTATATSDDGNGNTSEFSECVAVFTLSPPAAPQLTPDTAETDEDTPTLDIAATALDVEWRVNSHPDVDSYRLLVGNSPLSPTLVITAGTAALLDANDNLTGVEVGFARLENVRPDVDYFLTLEAVDAESGRTVRSQEVKFTVASAAFSLTSQQATVAVAVGGSATVPVTLNAGGALFFPNVWLTADLGNTPLGVTARFVDTPAGFPDLTSSAPTRNLLISVDGSVAGGTYPLVITGYNGEVQEALTMQVIVGAGGKIYLPLVNR